MIKTLNTRREKNMAIKIELQSTIIPVEIGAFKFEVNMTDEKEKAFKAQLDDFLKQASELDETKLEDETKLKELLKQMYDDLLGEGSFDKMYNSAPNIGILSGVFIQLVQEFGKVAQSRVTSNPVLKMLERKKKTGKK